MRVTDVMTEASVTDSPADPLRAAARRMWEQQTGSLLIMDDGELIGIVTERDILTGVTLASDELVRARRLVRTGHGDLD